MSRREDSSHIAVRIDHERELSLGNLRARYLAFFVALIFTSLSLSIQFHSQALPLVWIKIIEILSWILFLVAGFSGLVQLRIYSHTNFISINCKIIHYLTDWIIRKIAEEKSMWLFFILGTVAQLIFRSYSLFL